MKIWKIIILIFIYTNQFAYLKVYTNFIILNQVVAEKTIEKLHTYVIKEWQKEKMIKKAKWALASLFSFTQFPCLPEGEHKIWKH